MMKIWKIGLSGVISACLISSVAKAEQTPEEILKDLREKVKDISCLKNCNIN